MGGAVVVNHGVKGLVDAIEVFLCDAQQVPLLTEYEIRLNAHTQGRELSVSRNPHR